MREPEICANDHEILIGPGSSRLCECTCVGKTYCLPDGSYYLVQFDHVDGELKPKAYQWPAPGFPRGGIPDEQFSTLKGQGNAST